MTIPALITRLDALTGPDKQVDATICRDVVPRIRPDGWVVSEGAVLDTDSTPAYTSSIDAALTLVPEGLEWHVAGPNKRHGNGQAWAGVFGEPFVGSENDSFAANPAIALTIACLRAMEAMS